MSFSKNSKPTPIFRSGPYAIAKVAGIKLCESYNRQYNTQFVAVMPTNFYGPPRKLLDVSRINAMGWTAKVTLREGVDKSYHWFLDNQDSYRNK